MHDLPGHTTSYAKASSALRETAGVSECDSCPSEHYAGKKPTRTGTCSGW